MKFLLVMAVLAGSPKVTVLTPGTEASTPLFCTEEAQFIEDTNNLEELKQLKKQNNPGPTVMTMVVVAALGLLTGYAVAKVVEK